jgi:hypothetical protein
MGSMLWGESMKYGGAESSKLTLVIGGTGMLAAFSLRLEEQGFHVAISGRVDFK